MISHDGAMVLVASAATVGLDRALASELRRGASSRRCTTPEKDQNATVASYDRHFFTHQAPPGVHPGVEAHSGVSDEA